MYLPVLLLLEQITLQPKMGLWAGLDVQQTLTST